MNGKNYEFVTCGGVFEHKKAKFCVIFKNCNKKMFHRDIWPIAHLESVNFKNITFSIGLLVGDLLKISKKKHNFD